MHLSELALELVVGYFRVEMGLKLIVQGDFLGELVLELVGPHKNSGAGGGHTEMPSEGLDGCGGGPGLGEEIRRNTYAELLRGTMPAPNYHMGEVKIRGNQRRKVDEHGGVYSGIRC